MSLSKLKLAVWASSSSTTCGAARTTLPAALRNSTFANFMSTAFSTITRLGSSTWMSTTTLPSNAIVSACGVMSTAYAVGRTLRGNWVVTADAAAAGRAGAAAGDGATGDVAASDTAAALVTALRSSG